MKEFHFTIREAFTNGLRPNKKVDRNRPFLTKAINVQSTEFGLENVDLVDYPLNTFTADIQMIFGEEVSLWEAAYLAEIDTDDWSLTTLMVYNAHSPDSQVGYYRQLAGQVHFMDMKDTWFLFNGHSVYFKTNHRKLRGIDNKVLRDDTITINTGVAHRGRSLIGGFNPSDFWNTEWENLFQAWNDSVGTRIPFAFDDIGENYVMWSSIGGGDFPLWLIYPQIAVEGIMDDYDDDFTYNLEDMMLLDRMRRGEFGFMPMPFQGQVMKMIPMGKNIIVYGEDGVVALTPTRPTEPNVPPTYGLKHICNRGIPERGGAAGSEKGPHMFIDASGAFWVVDRDLKATRLGYEEYGKPYIDRSLGRNIHMTYLESRNNFYFTNLKEGIASDDQVYKTLIFDEGLTQKHQSIYSITDYKGKTIGFEQLSDFSFRDYIEIVTNTFDMGQRASKTVTTIRLGLDSDTDVTVAIDYRVSRQSDFVRSPFFPINDEGVSEIRVQGIEFRLIIKAEGTLLGKFNLDYAEIRYQVEDKRYVRGTSTSQTPS